jgi:hypothetical protein
MRKYIRERKYVYTAMALATVATLASGMPALADNSNAPTNTPSSWDRGEGGMPGRGMARPGVVGTVSAINGNILTVSGRTGFGANKTSTTYTVDASNATVTKNRVASTFSAIAVGDIVAAQGTLTGTNLVATTIRDGVMTRGQGKGPKDGVTSKVPPPITGNGQPIVAGTVSSITGSTMVITNNSNVTYTIDITNAKITKGVNTASITDVTVGDMVVVQGTVNGTNIVASSIIDQTKPLNNPNAQGTNQGKHLGFFGGIGSFFAHIFGF